MDEAGTSGSVVAEALVRIPCPFCDRMHTGEFWDEVDEQIMACRDRASPRKRGDLDGIPEDEMNRNAPLPERIPQRTGEPEG